MRQECLTAIGDPSALIRATVGIIVTTIVSKEGIHQWPGLLSTLLQMLDSPQIATVEGAFGAFQKISEDSAELLASDEVNKPAEVLIDKFLKYFLHENGKIRF